MRLRSSQRRPQSLRLLLAASLLSGGALALPHASAADVVDEVHYVKSVNGSVIRVEVRRDRTFDASKQPVILTYSPYNSLGEPAPLTDAVGSRYVPKGYARAFADVLGTRGSTGCWDYGGKDEIQSGVDVVKFLAGKTADDLGATLGWSNGKVGMTGVSYEGTTADMVASTGIPELAAVVPVAAISHWYGYAYYAGVRYAGNSVSPTDEGIDTPLGFDFGFAKTVIADPRAPHFAEVVASRAGECGAVAHTKEAYSRSPDYGPFWQERDYTLNMSKWRASTMLVHGWQDYNVKQDEATRFYNDIPVDNRSTPEVEGARYRKMWLTQSTHANGSGAGYQNQLDAFWAATLKDDADAGATLDALPDVSTLGRTQAGAKATYTKDAAYPPVGTKDVVLNLDRSFLPVPGVPSVPPATTTGEVGVLQLAPGKGGNGWTWVSGAALTEEASLRDPTNRNVTTQNGQDIRGHGYASLYHESAPLTQDARMVGSAVLDAYVNPTNTGQHLTPLLVEVLPSGTLKLVERGFLNLDYARGLAKADPKTGWQHAAVTFLPQDYTFTKGSRIGLILQSSNTVWALPGNPGAISVAMTPGTGIPVGSALHLPLVGLTGSDVLPQ